MTEKKKSLTFQEVLETKHPYIKYRNQVIVTDFWPKKSCRHCCGTGVMCLYSTKAAPNPKIQPNSLCQCGSGKKYKKCCSRLVEEARKANFTIMTCKCVGVAKTLDRPNTPMLKEALQEIMNGQQ